MTPTATYRLQLRPNGFGFEEAAAVADYLRSLGVSHVYLSPVLQAAPGSTHGYDVVDPTRLNEQLGGEEGFEQLGDTFERNGLGIVVDVVPNHMGLLSPHNVWWWDVLQHGPDSEYARYFDIAWRESVEGIPYVVVPQLGRELVDEIVDGTELRVEAHSDAVRVVYHEHAWPIRPGSIASMDLDESDPEHVSHVLASDRGRLLTLLSRQHYRLTHWRRANRDLNYRRFFDITTLGGVRVEDPTVFEATHERILGLVASGRIEGLRIDHPDGLLDPTGYVERLRAAAPRAWIVLEKILEPHETPRRSWPADGTVGYEACNLLLDLFVDPAAEAAFGDLYRQVTGESDEYREVEDEAKRQVLGELFAAEFEHLVTLLERAATDAGVVADRDLLAAGLAEVLVAFPVYRTYVRAADGVVARADRRFVDEAVARARARGGGPDDVLELIRDLLLLEQGSDVSVEFVPRFQQLTGPLMAKGVEDTSFYRYLRFAALNEVGGSPARFGVGLGTFHHANARRLRDWPASMVTTSTHDTKRSEDVRARLAVLTEMPDTWVRCVQEWREITAPHRRGRGPSPNLEYLLYQTVVGAWPIEADRLGDYIVKAAREEKRETSWLDIDEHYEQDLRGFVRRILDDEAFRGSVQRFLQDVIEPGWLTALSQSLLKYTIPGVPDTYQGCELWDGSLVDPDNRRPVDFDRRRKLLGELTAGMHPAEIIARMEEGLPKLWVTHQALETRRARPDDLGPQGGYQPLHAAGARHDHVVAFRRGDGVVAVAPRLVVGLGGDFVTWDWDDTSLELPAGEWRDVFTGEIRAGGQVGMEVLLSDFPVALLVRGQ